MASGIRKDLFHFTLLRELLRFIAPIMAEQG
jgi:hypothetical protein